MQTLYQTIDIARREAKQLANHGGKTVAILGYPHGWDIEIASNVRGADRLRILEIVQPNRREACSTA